MKALTIVSGLAALLPGALACGADSCYGATGLVEHVRQVKRMQPGAVDAPSGPTRQLEWGHMNILQTTDTHGWLEGNIKDPNYGADWGDWVSYVRRMKQIASRLKVDLLLVDTGDLHDGNGLSDETSPDGEKSMPIFDEVPYDLLTIGNHELYVSAIAYQMFEIWARRWGERYITSNVQIFNQTSKQFEYIGRTHRYFTTEMGVRVLAFGVLFDFTGNSNASKVIPAAEMVKQAWFDDALRKSGPVDLVMLLGHNAVRPTEPTSTIKTVWDAIREVLPKTPILVNGGHTHLRDFAVYDDSSVGLESGRYCETFGWLSMKGFDASNSGYHGASEPRGVPLACRKATNNSDSPFTFSRRYLDWNRRTMVWHSEHTNDTFDTPEGLNATAEITEARVELRLGEVIGCVPKTYCIDCVPFDDPNNIYPAVMMPAVSKIIVNESRSDRARLFTLQAGLVRDDLLKGPFTIDDKDIVSPFTNVIRCIHDVPYDKVKNMTAKLNGGFKAKRDLAAMPLPAQDSCVDPSVGFLSARDLDEPRGIVRRQETVTPGYATTDDWGDDGDDTVHTPIDSFPLPTYFESQANFPEDKEPETVDYMFADFFEKDVLAALGPDFSEADVSCYIDCNFTVSSFLVPYAKLVWQDNINNCTVG